jgi:two-component system OmpR family response regulator
MKKEAINIYLVDDDPTYANILEHVLKQDSENKINTKIFTSGEDCLKELKNSSPEIIILDYYLDRFSKNAANGLKILQSIKAIDSSIEVVMLSNQEKLEIAVSSIKLGAYDYVTKNETAYIRLKYLIRKIVNTTNLKKEMNRYEIWNWIIASICVLTILYFIYTHSTRHN